MFIASGSRGRQGVLQMTLDDGAVWSWFPATVRFGRIETTPSQETEALQMTSHEHDRYWCMFPAVLC